MSQENVEVVRRLFEATNRRDFATAMDAYANNVVLVVADAVVPTNAGTFTGREAVGEWLGDWFRAFGTDYHFELEEVRSLGDRVLTVVSHHGTGWASGAEVQQITANAYTVREGKIVRLEFYRSRTEALKAVGLEE